VSETIKRLGTDQLQQLQDAVKAELRSRDSSEADHDKLSRLSAHEFKMLVSDLMEAPKAKTDKE
jgi:hypothetical protein